MIARFEIDIMKNSVTFRGRSHCLEFTQPAKQCTHWTVYKIYGPVVSGPDGAEILLWSSSENWEYWFRLHIFLIIIYEQVFNYNIFLGSLYFVPNHGRTSVGLILAVLK